MLLHYYLTPRKLLDTARSLRHSYGWRTPAVVAARVATYLGCLLFRARKTFTLDGRDYSYAINLQNATFRVERSIEIPVALQKLPLRGDILEVGNVLSQYLRFPHDVVDKYESSKGVLNVDIAAHNPGKQYDLVLSISTLEHVGWDEVPKEPCKLLRAVERMKALLKPGGHLLVTVPLGYNDFLDARLQDGALGFTRTLFMKRTSRWNDWVETSGPDALGRKYGSRYPCANAVAIGLFVQEPAAAPASEA